MPLFNFRRQGGSGKGVVKEVHPGLQPPPGMKVSGPRKPLGAAPMGRAEGVVNEPKHSVQRREPARTKGTSSSHLKAYSGRNGVAWIRGSDDKFRRYGTARMVHQPAGSPGLGKGDEKWKDKEHVLLQFGNRSARYGIGDVSFTPKD